MTEVHLRRAVEHDAYALWVWANDRDTRVASHGRPPIPWQQHLTWLERQLNDGVILIAENSSGQPVGSARFDTADAWATARLSYVIAPEARGHQLSRPLIAAATVWLARHLGPITVCAEVMTENQRSLRVFQSLGWREEPSAPPGIRRFVLDPPVRGQV